MIKNTENTELTEKNIKDLEIVKKFLKKNHNIDDVDNENISSLKKYINDSNYGESWKENKLFVLSKYFKSIGRKYIMLKKGGIIQMKNRKKIELKKEQTDKEKENYLTYGELNVILKKYENYTTVTDMNRYLILASICTDQPPLRPQIYADLKIIYDKKDINDTDNFLVLDFKKKSGYFYINDDKVTNDDYEIHFDDDKKIIMGKTFYSIVVETLDKVPRKNFIEFDVENMEKKLLYELQKITNLKFTFDMARSSYVNHWHEINPDASDEEKENFAKQMRHTYTYQRLCYYKKNPVSGNLKLSDTESDNEDDNDNTDLRKMRKYIKDLIYSANKRNGVIKDDTIKKYGILQKEDGEYYIPKIEKKKEKVITIPKETSNPKLLAKRRNDIIRYANKNNSGIKPETCKFYNIEKNDDGEWFWNGK